ncbi:hypothetical protein JTB14_030702 [Gonioctena quinquepunctata]|nr:hypothetical protein JTB14_030702 [Gonioctena quinquepunctata]
MPGPKPKNPGIGKTTSADMERAVYDIVRGGLSTKASALRHTIPRTTLRRYLAKCERIYPYNENVFSDDFLAASVTDVPENIDDCEVNKSNAETHQEADVSRDFLPSTFDIERQKCVKKNLSLISDEPEKLKEPKKLNIHKKDETSEDSDSDIDIYEAIDSDDVEDHSEPEGTSDIDPEITKLEVDPFVRIKFNTEKTI